MKPVTGFYLECNHLVAAITADRPCPTCAAIAQTVEKSRAKALKEAVTAIEGKIATIREEGAPSSIRDVSIASMNITLQAVKDLAKGAGGD